MRRTKRRTRTRWTKRTTSLVRFMQHEFGVALTLIAAIVSSPSTARAAEIDFSESTVVVRSGDNPAAEKIAATVLTEEIARRTGLTWTVTDRWPEVARAVIALSTITDSPAWKDRIPTTALASRTLRLAEGFS